MIVSKEPHTSDALREFLRACRSDWGTEVLRSGEEAVKQLYDPQTNRPAMLFVDLPGLPDGKRLIEWVKMAGKTNAMPVIAIGRERNSDANMPLSGVDGVLNVPIDAKAVEAIVQKFVVTPDVSRPTVTPDVRRGH